ncbi:MAG: DoxX family protein [Pseudomonadota bacterium]
MAFYTPIIQLHDGVFNTVQRAAGDWFIPTAARFVFAGVLVLYYWNSGLTKISDGVFGFLNLKTGAYFSILGEETLAQYGFDPSMVPFHLDAIVHLGTWAEFILPAIIVIGLFTRAASLGMIVFVIVQSYVDVVAHKVDAKTVGMLFDRDSGSLIMDQRALWIFLLMVLVVKGAGALSVDRLLSSRSA